MRGDSEQLGKQSVDDIITVAFRQYRRHLELLYPFLGFGIVSLVLEFRFELLLSLFEIDRSFSVTANPDPLRDLLSEPVSDAVAPVLEEIFVLLLLGILSLFAFTLLVFLFAAGITFLVASDEGRENAERTQSARAVAVTRRLPALFAASFIGAVLIAAGSLLFVLPGLYLASRLVLGGPAIVIDGYGPLAGLREGWRRSSGQLFEVFAVSIGGAAVVSVVGFVPLIGEAVSVLVLMPVFLLALGNLYLDGPATR